MLPGVWPGTQIAHTEPSLNTSTTPSKRPPRRAANFHSLSGVVALEQPPDVRSQDQVLHRSRRGLAGSRVDRRVLGNVGQAHHVIEMEMGQEHAGERTALREERREIGAHDELLLDLHEVGDEAAHGGALGIVDGAFDARVDDEHPVRGMLDRVEPHDDRLCAVDETGRLRLRMLEIQQPDSGTSQSAESTLSSAIGPGRSRTASSSSDDRATPSVLGLVGWCVATQPEASQRERDRGCVLHDRTIPSRSVPRRYSDASGFFRTRKRTNSAAGTAG